MLATFVSSDSAPVPIAITINSTPKPLEDTQGQGLKVRTIARIISVRHTKSRFAAAEAVVDL